MSGVGDCGVRLAQPLAATAKRIDATAPLFTSTVAEHLFRQLPGAGSSEFDTFSVSAAAPPLAHLLIPLRI
ncbi:MAG TPA: hypothetical protein VES67_20505 [Vicinamibacterales bacterium]|nr:hypothetical protein [Vicinamibacterales bacterium]